MKKNILLFLILCLVSSSVFALTGELVYVEGTVDLKTTGGSLEYADIGMSVKTGDSIITGFDGYAELELEDGSSVKVNEDSIFKLESFQTDSEPRNNFQLVLGSAGYKFSKAMKDQEPTISTPSTVCGLRGTEFSVMAGIDGSAVYVVKDGSVAVTAKGSEVVLGADEGVEVLPGQVPGEPFKRFGGKVDYSSFRARSEKSFFDDPAGAVYTQIDQLIEYADSADAYYSTYLSFQEQVEPLYEQRDKLDGDAKKKFYQESILPLEIIASKSKQNQRYFSLAALSLRRYVISSMYVQMKIRYLNDLENGLYLDFIDAYNEFIYSYETRIVPLLVEKDIK